MDVELSDITRPAVEGLNFCSGFYIELTDEAKQKKLF